MKYTYGSDRTAAERLFEISKFFNKPAVELIRKYNKNGYKTGIDIGCGPGYTTGMLSRALCSNNVTGLDMSDNFISLAKVGFPELNFIKHDITQTPFPVSAETAYARFILSHLKKPDILIDKWANELEDNGILFIDELEDIYTEMKAFRKYLKINTELVASQGADLFVGRIIANGKYKHRVLHNETIKLPVPEWQAASWFYPNTVSVWKNDEFLKNRITEKERKQISENILEVMESGENKGNTFWIMRRIVIVNKYYE